MGQLLIAGGDGSVTQTNLIHWLLFNLLLWWLVLSFSSRWYYVTRACVRYGKRLAWPKLRKYKLVRSAYNAIRSRFCWNIMKHMCLLARSDRACKIVYMALCLIAIVLSLQVFSEICVMTCTLLLEPTTCVEPKLLQKVHVAKGEIIL